MQRLSSESAVFAGFPAAVSIAIDLKAVGFVTLRHDFVCTADFVVAADFPARFPASAVLVAVSVSAFAAEAPFVRSEEVQPMFFVGCVPMGRNCLIWVVLQSVDILQPVPARVKSAVR